MGSISIAGGEQRTPQFVRYIPPRVLKSASAKLSATFSKSRRRIKTGRSSNLWRMVTTVQPLVTLQPQYSLLSSEIEWEIVPAARYNGLGLLPWSPLAGGFLARKYKRGSAPALSTRAGSQKPLYQWTSEEYADSDRNWAAIDAVVRIAKELD
jgi:aryl-alcohol dehydrogenase-like predicted oxidoreductase